MPPFDLDRYRELHHGGRVGARVHYRERTASTMDDAREAAALRGTEGCGDAFVAGVQTAGRGRFRREWLDAPGASLLVTFRLCLRDLDAASLVGPAAALAAGDAVSAASGLETALKWPNDVLAGGRKLAGILVESRAAEDGVDVLLGIGTNVREAAVANLPEDARALATSIEGAGSTPPPLEVLLAALAEQLESRLDQAEHDPASLHAEWRARLVTLGTRVRLASGDGAARELFEGEAIDVTRDGRLVLRLDSRDERAFSAGDVTTVREPGQGERA